MQISVAPLATLALGWRHERGMIMSDKMSDAEFLRGMADADDWTEETKERFHDIADRLEQPADVASFNEGAQMLANALIATFRDGGGVGICDINDALAEVKRTGPAKAEPTEAECIVWAMSAGHVWAVYTWGEFSHWQYDSRDGMTRHIEYDGNIPFLTPEVLADIRRRMKEAAQ